MCMSTHTHTHELSIIIIMTHHQIKADCKKQIIIQKTQQKQLSFNCMSPHWDLEHEDSKQIVLHDTLANNDAPSCQGYKRLSGSEDVI